MSKAYKCDACGKLFESRLVPFWIKSAIKPNETLDICDLCKAEFEHWLDPTKYEECEESSKEIADNLRETHPCYRCVHHKESLDSDICASCHMASNFIEPSCLICKYGDLYSFDDPCVRCIRETHSLFEYDREKNKTCEEDNRSCHTCMYGNCSPSEDPCMNCDNYSNYVDKKEVNNV